VPALDVHVSVTSVLPAAAVFNVTPPDGQPVPVISKVLTQAGVALPVATGAA
jgi:hypothetical protein